MTNVNTSPRVQVSIADAVARIRLTNPPLNIIDIPMMEELIVGLRDVEARDDVTAVILAGSDRAFSAGVDIPAHQPNSIDEMLRNFHHVITAIVASSKI